MATNTASKLFAHTESKPKQTDKATARTLRTSNDLSLLNTLRYVAKRRFIFPSNKHKGIYCVPCESAFAAFKAAQINNANVISMGINVVGPGNACMIVDSYLESSFAIGGDENRVAFLGGLLEQVYEKENENFK